MIVDKDKDVVRTYNLCETLIKDAIKDIYSSKSYFRRNELDQEETLSLYYKHLEIIQNLRSDYMKTHNLVFKNKTNNQ